MSRSEQLTITIDDKVCSAEKGEFLLDVAKRNGIFIPTICRSNGLEGLGACRMCIVEVSQPPRPGAATVAPARTRVVTSCIYPVESEIVVATQSARIKEMRGLIITFLAKLAPDSELIANMARYMGVDLPRLQPASDDGGKCILCGRCVTACEQVGTGAIAKVNRGITKLIATPYEQPSAECIGCTACANICPTGAISCVHDERSVTIWDKTFTYLTCANCGKPFATPEQYEFIKGKSKADLVGQRLDARPPLCDECEKRLVGRSLAVSAQDYDKARD